MGSKPAVVLHCMLMVISALIDGVLFSEEKRLITKLLSNYEQVGKVGRPVFNTSQTISVQYGLALIQLLDLDEKNQILTTNCWSRYIWKDILLQWDPEDFGGVDHVRVPTDKIWTPDIVLYNYADDRLQEYRKASAVVSYDGGVLWIPQAMFKSSCVIDITHFPFDRQVCKMKFGSWTYDGFKLDMEFYSGEDQIDLNDYVPSNEWDIITHKARKNVKYYPCCREPYPDLTFTLELKRQVAFYNYILILPCVLLSSLTLVLFWLPPESPAKMVLGMNIFVAFFVLLLLLAESTPPAASSIPLIGAYYCLNMIMITLSTFLSVIVINLYFRGDKNSKCPTWLKKLFIGVLAKIMCMRTDLLPSQGIRNRKSSLHTTDGSALLKDSKHSKRKIKCPEMKYNKFQLYDFQDGGTSTTASATMDNHQHNNVTSDNHVGTSTSSTADGGVGEGRSPGLQRHSSQRQTLESDVKDIRRFLRQLLSRVHAKEERAKVAAEWKIVALVLDRLFFFCYLAAIVISLATIFPKTY